MSEYQNGDKQLALMMMLIHDRAPGSVCLDASCPTGELVPHMANDGAEHPHPYGRMPPFTASTFRRFRRDRRRLRLVPPFTADQ